MQMNIEPEVYHGFHKLKQIHKAYVSDSEFLSLMVSHIQKYGFTNENSHEEGRVRSNIQQNVNDKGKTCPECKFSAVSSEELWNHFDSIHNLDGSYSCTCGDSFTQLPAFLRHYVDCPVAATDLQDPYRDGLPFKKGRNFHLGEKLQHNNDDHISSPALRPSEIYQTYRQTTVHPIAGPSMDKPYGCPKCFKGFKSKSLLDQHMHLHYPPRYKCRWCGNVYRWPPVYYHHKQRCKKRPLLNNVGFDASKQVQLRVVDGTQHPKERITIAQQALAQFMNIQNMPFSQDPNADSCNSKVNGETSNVPLTYLCSENFPTATSYLEHLGVCSNVSTFESLTSQTPAIISGQHINRLDQRVSAVELRHSSRPEDLLDIKDISLISHPNMAMFPCSICNKEFNSKLSLRQHVDGKHRAEGKYICPTCGKRYRWGASFYYHKKTCASTNRTLIAGSRAPELITNRT